MEIRAPSLTVSEEGDPPRQAGGLQGEQVRRGDFYFHWNIKAHRSPGPPKISAILIRSERWKSSPGLMCAALPMDTI